MSNSGPRPIFLLTDFGRSDPYVGLMKAVILQSDPSPDLVDLTHQVEPQDEINAAFLLEYVIDDLPPESVVLLVVDPKVGTDRDIIAVETGQGRTVLAPDRGLVNGLDWNRARYVTNDDLARSDVSSTFHGRDWFAPVGRFLSQGGALEELGPSVEGAPGPSIVPDPEVRDGELIGRVVHVDHFGNAITNLKSDDLDGFLPEWRNRAQVHLNGHRITDFVETYDDGAGPVGLIGSFERLELAVPDGSAARQLDVAPGAELTLAKRERVNR